jgi:hypothetical protein
MANDQDGNAYIDEDIQQRRPYVEGDNSQFSVEEGTGGRLQMMDLDGRNITVKQKEDD